MRRRRRGAAAQASIGERPLGLQKLGDYFWRVPVVLDGRHELSVTTFF